MKPGRSVLVAGALLIAGLWPSRASAQFVVHGEQASVKFGILGQFWGTWAQGSATGTSGYQQNFYLRRARLIMGGDIGDNIGFFFETDNPKLGVSPKALGSGFILQDALMEWRADNKFMLSAGLMLVPFSRTTLQSPASYYTLDGSAITAVNNAATQSSGYRDTGFAAKGFFFKDKLSYRAGVFAGQRDASGRNSLRTAGLLQYDFFGSEKGYTFVGTALGKQKILAVNAGVDKQGAYRAWSASVAANFPVHDGDEIGGQLQYIYYDGRQKFLTIAAQNDFLLEAAYYNRQAKLQPFVKYDSQNFVAAANHAKNIDRYGAGVNYYIHGQNLKWTMQYLRVLPAGVSLAPGNELGVQLQLFYY
jgi:hypothetical protein